jgi:serine protease inhibitor
MKMKFLFISMLMGFMLLSSCLKKDELALEPMIIQLNKKGSDLVNSSSNFGFKVFQETVKSEDETTNLMISPLGISLAIAMVYNGADGNTKTVLENTLGLNNLTCEEININFKQITEALFHLDNSVNFSIANSIWYRNDFTILPVFKDINEDFYNAKIAGMDFNSSNAKDIINGWISYNTDDKITSIIDQVNPDDVLLLMNAVCFKGQWKYKFDKGANFYYDFNLSDGKIKRVEMMRKNLSLPNYSNELMSMVEMPLGQGNWAMDLILPRYGKTLNDVVDELTGTEWKSWISSLSGPSPIQISMPPFKFAYSKNLKDVLSVLGMSIAFDQGFADFSKISTTDKVYISELMHKSLIDVNEDGTEAVTDTSEGTTNSSIGDGMMFNRPFLFVIREVSSGTILFIGKVENPEQ